MLLSGSPAPPSPRANRVLGSALDLRRSQIRTYERVMREHGDVVRLKVGPPGVRFDLYCVFHPDAVRAVLAGSRGAYSKGSRFYQRIAETFGWGLLTSEGERWQRQRRLIQPLFTRREIATYSDLMAEEAAAVAERWERASRDGDAVDANAEMVELTLRVVGRAIFGDDLAKAPACSTRPSRCSPGTPFGARCRRWPRPSPGLRRRTAGRRTPAPRSTGSSTS